jgi:ubiquinone biosynthesis protein COQ4
MMRHRQVHDFWHSLVDLGTSVEEEIALKWFEFVQTGLPVALLSSTVGPLRLTPEQRERLFTVYVPWAVQCGSKAPFLLNMYYEELLDKPVKQLQEELGLIPAPKISA